MTVRKRLRLIERAAYWRGWMQRQDLSVVFGKGSAQASTDFQKYPELNPGALAYSTSRKRYEGQEAMRQALQQSRLAEDAVHLFLSGSTRLPYGAVAHGIANTSLDWVVLPRRLAAVRRSGGFFEPGCTANACGCAICQFMAALRNGAGGGPGRGRTTGTAGLCGRGVRTTATIVILCSRG